MRALRPRAAVVALVATGALLPAVAGAAPARLHDGRFRGPTTEHRTARLAIVAHGRRVTYTIPWARISGRRCTPSRAFVNASFVFDRRRGAAIHRDRTFAERIVTRQRLRGGLMLHYDVRVAGRFARTGARVNGTVRVGVRFTRRNRRGTIASCSSRLSFTARRA